MRNRLLNQSLRICLLNGSMAFHDSFDYLKCEESFGSDQRSRDEHRPKLFLNFYVFYELREWWQRLLNDPLQQ
jgi:hypothetical protein